MNKITGFDPFEEIRALQRQFFSDDWLSSPLKNMQIATTDVYTEDNKLVIEAHLPNFSKEDVHVELDHGALVIQAQRHEKEEDKKKQYVIRESNSSFYRKIQLPERADDSAISADMKDGLLQVVVPLKELPAPKRIEISAKSAH